MSIENIRNYIQVSETIASSGQPDADEFQIIAAAGYDVVVNLAMPDSAFAIPEEGNIVTAAGMSYVHLPVPFETPAADHLRQFIRIVQIYSERKVWVHCALNYRVSAFLYQYQRLVNGLPHEEARKAMLGSWQPDAVWQAFMAMSYGDIKL